MRTTSLFDLHLWGILALGLIFAMSRVNRAVEISPAMARIFVRRLTVCTVVILGSSRRSTISNSDCLEISDWAIGPLDKPHDPV